MFSNGSSDSDPNSSSPPSGEQPPQKKQKSEGDIIDDGEKNQKLEGDGMDDGDTDSWRDPDDFESDENAVYSADSDHSLNDEEMKEYNEVAGASEGFEVPDFGKHVSMCQIVPLKFEKYSPHGVHPLCVAAMDYYNKQEVILHVPLRSTCAGKKKKRLLMKVHLFFTLSRTTPI